MTLRKQILTVAETLAVALGHTSLATISTKYLGNGARLGELRDGRDLTTGKFEEVMQRFSDDWPDAATWPEGIPRPAPKHQAA